MGLLRTLLGIRPEQRRSLLVEGKPLPLLIGLESLEPSERSRAALRLLAKIDSARFRPALALERAGGALGTRAVALGLETIDLEGEPARLDALARERGALIVSFGFRRSPEPRPRRVQLVDRTDPLLERAERRERARSCREAALVVARSSQLADYAARRLAAPARRLQVVPQGIELPAAAVTPESRAGARKALGLADDAIVFLSLGDFVPTTGHRLALKAFETLAPRQPRAVLLCAGDPVAQDELEACRAAAQGLPAQVLGLEAGTDLERFFACADFFVQPVGWDGLRPWALAALGRGAPLVAPRTADASELAREHPIGQLFSGRSDAGVSARRARRLVVEPGADEARPLATALEVACRSAAQLREAASHARGEIEACYEAEAVARCFEGALLTAASGG